MSDDGLKKIISHAKEYGFVFPSSEIYDGLSAAYDLEEGDLDRLAKRLHTDASTLEGRFRAWVVQQAQLGASGIARRKKLEEARHFGRIGDYERANRLLAELLDADGDDAEVRYTLAFSQFNQGRAEVATATLGPLLESGEGEFHAYGWLLQARIEVDRERPDAAQRALERVLESSAQDVIKRRAERMLSELSD